MPSFEEGSRGFWPGKRDTLKRARAGNGLSCHSSDGCAVNSDFAAAYQKKIQRHIDKSGQNQHIERRSGITYSPQPCRQDIIKEGKEKSCGDDSQIVGCQRGDFVLVSASDG